MHTLCMPHISIRITSSSMASNIEDALIKAESIQVNHGILGRTFNYGSLIISGAGDPQAPVPGISDPMSLRRVFMGTPDQAGQTRTA